MRKLDLKEVENQIVEGIKNFSGSKDLFIGISGGIDSAVTAYLCVKALGKRRVFGILMPYGQQKDIADSLNIVHRLDIKYFQKDIRPIVDQYKITNNRYAIANIMSRVRMTILYAYANSKNGLVVGTTNKSEFEIGYFTKFGDGGCDFEPIMNLYKTEIFQLANQLGIPKNIIDKQPSAGLMPDQTDEGDIGFSYADLDNYLQGGHVSSDIEVKIKQRMDSAKHKQQLPFSIPIN